VNKNVTTAADDIVPTASTKNDLLAVAAAEVAGVARIGDVPLVTEGIALVVGADEDVGAEVGPIVGTVSDVVGLVVGTSAAAAGRLLLRFITTGAGVFSTTGLSVRFVTAGTGVGAITGDAVVGVLVLVIFITTGAVVVVLVTFIITGAVVGIMGATTGGMAGAFVVVLVVFIMVVGAFVVVVLVVFITVGAFVVLATTVPFVVGTIMITGAIVGIIWARQPPGDWISSTSRMLMARIPSFVVVVIIIVAGGLVLVGCWTGLVME
jgi:hypothetical protein